MKFLVLLQALLLSSCIVKEAVITEKWHPVDAHELGTYPIRDTNSCAIGFVDLMTGEKIYGRDRKCTVYCQYNLGDTVNAVFKKSPAQ